MSQLVRRGRPEVSESDRSAFDMDEDIVPTPSRPSAGRAPMRSELLRKTAVEDTLLIRDDSRE